jgi:leucyl aminopeptidase
MKIAFAKEAKNTDVAVVIGVFENNKLTAAGQLLDTSTGGLISKALSHSHFKGKVGQTLSLVAPNDLKVRRILLVGFGEEAKSSEKSLQEVGGHLYKALSSTPDQEAVLHLDGMGEAAAEMAANISYGLLQKSWRFDQYKTKEKPEDKPSLKAVTVLTEHADQAQKRFEPLEATAQGIFLCRALASEPGNRLYPENYADRIQKELKPLGIEVEVLDVPTMEKLGMGALLGVGMGSAHEPRLVVMQYHGGPKDQKPLTSGRYRYIDVRADHSGRKYGCRRPIGSLRCALVYSGPF